MGVPVFGGKPETTRTDFGAQTGYNGPRMPFSRDPADLPPQPNTILEHIVLCSTVAWLIPKVLPNINIDAAQDTSGRGSTVPANEVSTRLYHVTRLRHSKTIKKKHKTDCDIVTLYQHTGHPSITSAGLGGS